MKKSLTVGCVIMASGLSRRFGTNKLLADFCGQPMLCRAFDATATPGIAARIVVTRSEEVQALCRAQGVPVLLHSLPGRNDTVRLGLSALLEQLPELSGCMFLPGDQPLLEVPFCLEAVSFRNCSPCRKIKAATCCLKSILRRCARFTLRTAQS